VDNELNKANIFSRVPDEGQDREKEKDRGEPPVKSAWRPGWYFFSSANTYL
jgi:hypothetical protein